MNSKEIIKNIIKEIYITEENECSEIEDMQDDTLFESIGMDSIKYVQLIIEIEDTFNITIPDEKLNMNADNTINKLDEMIKEII